MFHTKKAQSAVEFVILISVVLFFFIGLLIVIQYSISDKTYENRNVAFRETALSVQNEINLAYESTDGYYREFYVPEKVLGADYDITVQEGVIFVQSASGRHALSLPVPEDIEGTGIQKGDNVIRKQDGVVYLNG